MTAHCVGAWRTSERELLRHCHHGGRVMLLAGMAVLMRWCLSCARIYPVRCVSEAELNFMFGRHRYADDESVCFFSWSVAVVVCERGGTLSGRVLSYCCLGQSAVYVFFGFRTWQKNLADLVFVFEVGLSRHFPQTHDGHKGFRKSSLLSVA